jgi:hypothetical protein
VDGDGFAGFNMRGADADDAIGGVRNEFDLLL